MQLLLAAAACEVFGGLENALGHPPLRVDNPSQMVRVEAHFGPALPHGCQRFPYSDSLPCDSTFDDLATFNPQPSMHPVEPVGTGFELPT